MLNCRQALLLWLGVMLSSPLLALEPSLRFATDPAAARTAARQAADMVHFARVELDTPLDWSDGSIGTIEDITAALHSDLRRERGSYADVEALVEMLGSYVGEVYRRNHGGEWGYARIGGQKRMALRTAAGGRLLLPVERVRQRLRVAGHNVLAYYQRSARLAGD